MGKPFHLFLADYLQGQVNDELTEELEQLIEGVRNTGRAGTLTLSLKVRKANKGQAVTQLSIDHDVKSKLPPAERGSDFFYLDDEGDLTRQHPKQQSLELREAPKADTPMRQIGQ